MQSVARTPGAARPALTVLGFLMVVLPVVLAGACLLPGPAALATPGVAEPVDALVRVEGRTYEPQGRLYLTSVRLSPEPRLGQYLLAFLQPDVQRVPRSESLPPGLSREEFQTLSQRLLEESKSIAEVVALQQAGYNVDDGTPKVEVVRTLPGTPAERLLQPGDVIEMANGEPVSTVADLVSIVHGCVTGEPVALRIRREQRAQVVALPAQLGPLDTDGPVMGLVAVTRGLERRAPLKVTIDSGAVSGGVSGGLMYALGVYNALATEDITRGRRIAGTGSLRLDGSVGPVGGIQLKVRAAEDAGAAFFLAPAENVPAARAAARRIEVIPVRDFEQALEALRRIDAEPSGPRVVPAGQGTILASLPLGSGF